MAKTKNCFVYDYVLSKLEEIWVEMILKKRKEEEEEEEVIALNHLRRKRNFDFRI